ncbi:helix-turn-helix domain containing protein, partial [Dehalococcoidia bacterium]|nr:helix-turn-helix domain containing protein [Dehalococcoidia bacterium]
MDISYQEVYTTSKEEARRLIIETYLDTGNLSLTAPLWHTSRHVVRKWVRRFEEEGDEGIKTGHEGP